MGMLCSVGKHGQFVQKRGGEGGVVTFEVHCVEEESMVDQ